jgi:hypothetical protein
MTEPSSATTRPARMAFRLASPHPGPEGMAFPMAP